MLSETHLAGSTAVSSRVHKQGLRHAHKFQPVLFQQCKAEQADHNITAVLSHRLLDQMPLLACARPASLRLPVAPEKLARVQICLCRFLAILLAISSGLAIRRAGLGAGKPPAQRLARLLVAQHCSAREVCLPGRLTHCLCIQAPDCCASCAITRLHFRHTLV